MVAHFLMKAQEEEKSLPTILQSKGNQLLYEIAHNAIHFTLEYQAKCKKDEVMEELSEKLSEREAPVHGKPY